MEENKSELGKSKRELSNCVVSRWYRPPEIILTEKNYDQQVDLWSLGCILAELLHCSEQYSQDKKFRQNERFIFPGSSCFPLSPCQEMMSALKTKKQDKSKISHEQSGEKEVVNIVSQNDQMIKIIEVLGARDTDLDYSFVEDESVMKYLE